MRGKNITLLRVGKYITLPFHWFDMIYTFMSQHEDFSDWVGSIAGFTIVIGAAIIYGHPFTTTESSVFFVIGCVIFSPLIMIASFLINFGIIIIAKLLRVPHKLYDYCCHELGDDVKNYEKAFKKAEAKKLKKQKRAGEWSSGNSVKAYQTIDDVIRDSLRKDCGCLFTIGEKKHIVREEALSKDVVRQLEDNENSGMKFF